MAKDTKAKTTKPAKEKSKSTAKKKPSLFAADAVITHWTDPNPPVAQPHFAKPSVRHLGDLQLRYICSSFEHIKADIELLGEVRKTNDTDYEDIIEGNVSDGINSLINYLMDTRILTVNKK